MVEILYEYIPAGHKLSVRWPSQKAYYIQVFCQIYWCVPYFTLLMVYRLMKLSTFAEYYIFSSFSSLFCANKIYCFHWKPRKLSNIPIIKLLHSQTVIPSTNHTTITARPLKSVCVRVFDMHVKLTIMTAIQYSSPPKLIVSRYVLGSNRVDSGSCQQV